MFCGKCGGSVDESGFCVSCGAYVNKEETPEKVASGNVYIHKGPTVDPGKGLGTASLVLGIVGTVSTIFCFCLVSTTITLGSSATGLILGIIARINSKNAGFKNGRATAGIVLSAIGLLLGAVAIVISVVAPVVLTAITTALSATLSVIPVIGSFLSVVLEFSEMMRMFSDAAQMMA